MRRRDVVGDQHASGQVLRRAGQVRVVAGDVDARRGEDRRPVPQREVGSLGGDDLQRLVPRVLIRLDLHGLQRPPHLVVRAGGVDETADVVDRAVEAARATEHVVGADADDDHRRIEAQRALVR